MINEHKNIVIDLDGTICSKLKEGQNYKDLTINKEVVKKLKEYQLKGFYIIIYTSRNMRTYKGNVGKINANTLKIAMEWLDKNKISYDEIHIGKPWCGKGGFYVDDKCIRPDEFIEKTEEEINKLIN